MKEQIIQADVLCIGGGIAGLMGAIRASEVGVNVIVADKGNTLRSGAGSTGNDHFICYIPEVHGADIRLVTLEYLQTRGGVISSQFVDTWFKKTFDIVKLWESWGISMKYKGKYEFAGHGLPGRPLFQLKYEGKNQKKILTREAIKRNVKIFNRLPIFDLFNEGSKFGCIGVDLLRDEVIRFYVKSVLLCTGQCVRLYPGPTPAWMFNMAYPPNNTGDGRAMAYRLGAELISLEIPRRWVGPKYFSRCGRATWIGVLRDSQGTPIGPFVTKPDRKYGDATADVYDSLFDDYIKSGKGPIYMDCSGISDENFEYMTHWMEHEGLTSLLDHFREENIDLRKTPVEFMAYELIPGGGINFNGRGETSIKGLYAAGDELFGGGGISCAATIGWLAGENAAKYAQTMGVRGVAKVNSKFETRNSLIDKIRNREVGASWKEVNIILQQIMNDYAGLNRSELMLKAGLNYLRRLREKAENIMVAKNTHELMHCLEVLDLLDLGELVFILALERKETRQLHRRVDYPYGNPLMRKVLAIKKVGGKPVIKWREIN